MPQQTALLATLAIAFGLAFVFGFVAARLRLPPLVGYLAAGVAAGPFTPGLVADTAIAGQLAEVGVILLMFGVGLHFSARDLLAVRRIAVPGALLQIAVATALGAAVARLWGWPWKSAVVFGLTLSVSSTVVLLRALDERGALDSADGRIAVGWLIVQDLAMVVALVLLPALAAPRAGAVPAAPGGTPLALVLTVLKVAAFVALMLFVGSRAIPALLARVARTGSRELFTLSVLAIALGIAVGAASMFGVSFALGAFFAGVVVSESDVSHQAAADALPLRDAFAVLFFVSVGMLFDPATLIERPLAVAAALIVILAGQSLASFVLLLLFGRPPRAALTVAAGLAQIGEFSIVLAALGVSLGVLPREAQSLVLAAAIISITVNSLLFRAVEPLARWLEGHARLLEALERRGARALATRPADDGALRDHAVIVGFGRVGGTIGRAFERRAIPYLVIEQDREYVESLRARGIRVLFGDAARHGILEHAALPAARILVIAAPGAYQTRRMIELARRLAPGIAIVVRTHTEAEQRYLEREGVAMAVMGERELALGMTRYALRALGTPHEEIDAVVQALRSRGRDGDGTAPMPSASAPARRRS